MFLKCSMMLAFLPRLQALTNALAFVDGELINSPQSLTTSVAPPGKVKAVPHPPLDNQNNQPIDDSVFLKGRILTNEITGEDLCLSGLQLAAQFEQSHAFHDDQI
jgi:hypothetical protein